MNQLAPYHHLHTSERTKEFYQREIFKNQQSMKTSQNYQNTDPEYIYNMGESMNSNAHN